MGFSETQSISTHNVLRFAIHSNYMTFLNFLESREPFIDFYSKINCTNNINSYFNVFSFFLGGGGMKFNGFNTMTFKTKAYSLTNREHKGEENVDKEGRLVC